jgi:hypothetical protein
VVVLLYISVPVGWCSWYHFYDKITETNLEQNLGMMAKLRSESRHTAPYHTTHRALSLMS